MGLFKILLGPFGLGLPFRPTSKRERFQYNSVGAQRETNELLERLIDSTESRSSGEHVLPQNFLTPQEQILKLVAIGMNKRTLERTRLAKVFEQGTTVSAEVRSVIGWHALFCADDGVYFSIEDCQLFTNVILDTSGGGSQTSIEKAEIDVSEFGEIWDLHKFLRAGNRAEFMVSQVEVYEPTTSAKSLVAKVQDPNNRGKDPQRTANLRTKYWLTLSKVIETGLEDSLAFTVGDIIVGRLGSESGSSRKVEIQDGRRLEFANKSFPPPYRVREGTSKFWDVETGAQVWLRVLKPMYKHLPATQYQFEVIPPPNSN